MEKSLWAGTALWAFFCLSQARAWDAPFAADCTFYCSFDQGDLMADMSEGEPNAAPSPEGKAPVFSENGVRGKAMRAGGEDIQMLNWPAEGNFSFARPGTMSMWVQPVKWRRGLDLPADPNSAQGWRQITYTLFFGTQYTDKGYIGVQRMTSAATESPNSRDYLGAYSLLFPKMKDAKPGTRMDWADGEWHHVALTWNKEEIQLYADGKLEKAASFAGVIEPESDPKFFAFGSRGDPSLIDELALYNRALSPEEIKTLFEAY